jgi:hypothetical protein
VPPPLAAKWVGDRRTLFQCPYRLASGAFLVEENPDKTDEVAAMNVAAVRSARKLPSGILQQVPDAKWISLPGDEPEGSHGFSASQRSQVTSYRRSKS